MKYEKIFMCLVIGIFLISFASAIGEELSFEPNSTMNIVVKCYESNYRLCGDGVSCFLDLFYPNMTALEINRSMTNNGTYFSFNASPTNILGVYHAYATCSDDLTSSYVDFDFYVGQPSTSVQEASTRGGLYILFGISISFFVVSFFVKKNPYKWSLFLFGLLFLVLTINILSISLRNEVASVNVRNFFDKLGAMSYYMYWFIGGLFLIIWIFTLIGSIADKRNMDKARRIGEPWDLSKQ